MWDLRKLVIAICVLGAIFVIGYAWERRIAPGSAHYAKFLDLKSVPPRLFWKDEISPDDAKDAEAYYEVTFDDDRRIKMVKKFLRQELKWYEKYNYRTDGTLCTIETEAVVQYFDESGEHVLRTERVGPRIQSKAE